MPRFAPLILQLNSDANLEKEQKDKKELDDLMKKNVETNREIKKLENTSSNNDNDDLLTSLLKI